MRRARTLLLFGIWIAILPHLGFPYIWKNILLAISGLSLAYISYIIYKENKPREEKKSFENFSENRFDLNKAE